jgi:hypothetical protein
VIDLVAAQQDPAGDGGPESERSDG